MLKKRIKTSILIIMLSLISVFVYAKAVASCSIKKNCGNGVECSCTGNNCSVWGNGVRCTSTDGTSAECSC